MTSSPHIQLWHHLHTPNYDIISTIFSTPHYHHLLCTTIRNSSSEDGTGDQRCEGWGIGNSIATFEHKWKFIARLLHFCSNLMYTMWKSCNTLSQLPLQCGCLHFQSLCPEYLQLKPHCQASLRQSLQEQEQWCHYVYLGDKRVNPQAHSPDSRSEPYCSAISSLSSCWSPDPSSDCWSSFSL